MEFIALLLSTAVLYIIGYHFETDLYTPLVVKELINFAIFSYLFLFVNICLNQKPINHETNS